MRRAFNPTTTFDGKLHARGSLCSVRSESFLEFKEGRSRWSFFPCFSKIVSSLCRLRCYHPSTIVIYPNSVRNSTKLITKHTCSQRKNPSLKTMTWLLLLVVSVFFSMSQALVQPGASAYRMTDGVSFTSNRKDLTSLGNSPSMGVNEAENYEALMMNRVDYRNQPSIRHGGLGNHIEASPALVLNADYTPLNHLPLSLWNWQDTLRAVFGGKAIVVSEYADLYVRSVSHTFRLPSVIALTNYQRVVHKVPVMSRRNVIHSYTRLTYG